MINSNNFYACCEDDMKKLCLALLVAGCTMSASAATYYNCATNTGCVAQDDIKVSSSYAKTKYPMVFANGAGGGFNQIGSLNYWYNIPQDLIKNGASVYVTKAAALNSSEYRGEEVLQQVRGILAISNAGKVNLIGHSHGGQSVRYVAAVVPQMVASATTVAAPHKGSPVADLALRAQEIEPTNGILIGAVAAFANLIGMSTDYLSGNSGADQDAIAALNALSSAGTADFNVRFPMGVPSTACGQGASQVQGMRFYSWSGAGKITNAFDPSDTLLAATGLAVQGESDGLVPVCSSHFGKVIRDNFRMNHLDEVNQVAGLVSLFETNPISVFRAHANRLKNDKL